jgi:hypothetical protein
MTLEITSATMHEQIALADAIREASDEPLLPGCAPPIGYTNRQGLVMRASDFFTPIPRDHWPNLIASGAGSQIKNLREGRLPPHDQGSTNYCWAHGSTRAVELTELIETDRPLLLSAESIAVPITGGRNRGGNADEAFPRLRDKGACRQELWPHNSRATSLWTPDVAADAARHQLLDWAEVKGFDLQITMLFLGRPLALPLLWWGHLVCALAVETMTDGSVGIGIDNSWGPTWGQNGYGIVDEAHGTAEESAWTPITTEWNPTETGFADAVDHLVRQTYLG